MEILTDVDTREFDAMIENATKAMNDPAQKRTYVRSQVMDFISKVIPKTPVETGRARGGWTAMRGSVTATQGGFGRMGPNAVEGRRMSSYKERFNSRNAFAEITNGVPYIVYLELGSSRQAPAGFVRLTLREMSGQAAKEGEKWTMEQLRLANNKARREIGLRRGKRIYRGGTITGRIGGD